MASSNVFFLAILFLVTISGFQFWSVSGVSTDQPEGQTNADCRGFPCNKGVSMYAVDGRCCCSCEGRNIYKPTDDEIRGSDRKKACNMDKDCNTKCPPKCSKGCIENICVCAC